MTKPRKPDKRRRHEFMAGSAPDLQSIMQRPPAAEDIDRETAMPWERHPIPWDNVSPPPEPKKRKRKA